MAKLDMSRDDGEQFYTANVEEPVERGYGELREFVHYPCKVKQNEVYHDCFDLYSMDGRLIQKGYFKSRFCNVVPVVTNSIVISEDD